MEKKILLQAIVDSTLPKLLAIDAHIMELLLQRFFPETAIETVNESMQLLKVMYSTKVCPGHEIFCMLYTTLLIMSCYSSTMMCQDWDNCLVVY